ncbi:MAG: mercury(II) reductase [Candidatus Latescibacteria bacterium]|nr:mercury(II) reductase [Candidatus Latescibacterota bacterium]
MRRRSMEELYCCAPEAHLLVVGGGSAAFAATLKAVQLGARVTLVNEGLPIGGTCVNVGCVPSKTLIRAAEAHHRAGHHPFDGIASTSRVADFKGVMAQKQQLVEGLRQAKYLDVVADLEEVRIIEGQAHLVDAHTVAVNGQTLQADCLLIATGASPSIPPVPGLAESGYLTSTTALELEELPESLLVLGGRYIALELSQMFARLGSKVAILQRSARILPSETKEITDALTGYLEAEGIEIVTGVDLKSVRREATGFVVTAQVDGKPATFRAGQLLAATGRRPNTAGLGLEKAGVAVDVEGAVVVDEHLQTTAAGVYAAGDVVGEPAFVYTAAYEGALAAENALNGNTLKRDYTALPWVIFTDPQVAGVGLDEEQARAQGIEVDTVSLSLEHVPRALAARDTRGCVKLIRNRQTDRLVGARILAPEGSELTMELSLAIRYGIPVGELARAFHPYLTLSEAVKLAALSFEKDVAKLSCCAT